MFQIRPTEDKRWTVIDHHDRPVFQGTYQECEDWLDKQECEARSRSAPPGRVRSWLRALRALVFGTLASAARGGEGDAGEERGQDAPKDSSRQQTPSNHSIDAPVD